MAQQSVWSIFKQNEEYATFENSWQNTMAVEGQRGQVTNAKSFEGNEGGGRDKKEKGTGG